MSLPAPKSGKISAINTIGFIVTYDDRGGCGLALSDYPKRPELGAAVLVHFSEDGRPARAEPTL